MVSKNELEKIIREVVREEVEAAWSKPINDVVRGRTMTRNQLQILGAGSHKWSKK